MAKPKKRAVPKLTHDEFMYAWVAANAAFVGKMQVEIPQTKMNIEGIGTVKWNDVPHVRAMTAIRDTFKDEPEKAQAASFRIMWLAMEVMRHPKAQCYQRPVDKHHGEVARPLLEAIATISASYTKPPSVAKVVAFADRLARKYDSEET